MCKAHAEDIDSVRARVLHGSPTHATDRRLVVGHRYRVIMDIIITLRMYVSVYICVCVCVYIIRFSQIRTTNIFTSDTIHLILIGNK